MMQMLGAGGLELLTDGCRRADRDNPRGYFEYEPVKRLPVDVSWIDDAVGRAVKVVHALVHELPVGPEYRVLLMRRDLREVVASQRTMLARRGGSLQVLWEERLVELLRLQLENLERWLISRPDFALQRVDYNALLADPLDVAASVDAFLGGGLDVDDMVAVVEPALWHQRGLAAGS
jgi:hypothetical protein